jgi:ElaB/YqjD/DUF883 family membrane-anchored ribosome-binding protein
MMMERVAEEFDRGGQSDTPVTDKARHFAEEALEAASETAGNFERKLRDEREHVSDEVGERRREVGEQLDETLADVEGYIRSRPVAAAGMAFAAGLLTALILRR